MTPTGHPELKQCKSCKRPPQPRSNFYAHKSTSDGLQPNCKDCQREQQRQRKARIRAGATTDVAAVRDAVLRPKFPEPTALTWEEQLADDNRWSGWCQRFGAGIGLIREDGTFVPVE